ncbi:MAG: hypothetical protein PHQ27_06675 [Victivallales bacterium]|nr:hypothetical protein [Victivallales bacterium]
MAKGRDAAWQAALIGGGCGLLGGVVIWLLQWRSDMMFMPAIASPLSPLGPLASAMPSPWLCLLAPSLCGLLFHGAYASGQGIERAGYLLLAAVTVMGVIRFGSGCFGETTLIVMVFEVMILTIINLGGAAVFVLPWLLVLNFFTPHSDRNREQLIGVVMELGCIVFFSALSVLSLTIVGIFSR